MNHHWPWRQWARPVSFSPAFFPARKSHQGHFESSFLSAETRAATIPSWHEMHTWCPWITKTDHALDAGTHEWWWTSSTTGVQLLQAVIHQSTLPLDSHIMDYCVVYPGSLLLHRVMVDERLQVYTTFPPLSGKHCLLLWRHQAGLLGYLFRNSSVTLLMGWENSFLKLFFAPL